MNGWTACGACNKVFPYDPRNVVDVPGYCPSCRSLIKDAAVALEQTFPTTVHLVAIDEPGLQRSYINPKLVASVSPDRSDKENIDGRCRITMAHGDTFIAAESTWHVATKLMGVEPQHSCYTSYSCQVCKRVIMMELPALVTPRKVTCLDCVEEKED